MMTWPSTYLVVDTDYENYAVDIECQQFAQIINRRSATILSRTREMDPAKLDEVSTKTKQES